VVSQPGAIAYMLRPQARFDRFEQAPVEIGMALDDSRSGMGCGDRARHDPPSGLGRPERIPPRHGLFLAARADAPSPGFNRVPAEARAP
jgi:hypothetical protein